MYVKAAIDIEDVTGITGIGQYYVFPVEFDQLFLENKLSDLGGRYNLGELTYAKRFQGADVCLSKIFANHSTHLDELQLEAKNYRQYFEALSVLNPDLQLLSFDNSDLVDLYDALYGIVSGYSVTDINFFLNDRGDLLGTTSYFNEVCHVDSILLNKWSPLSGSTFMKWCPAPATMSYIKSSISGPENI